MASAVARQAVYMNYISKEVQFTPGEGTDAELFLNASRVNNDAQLPFGHLP